MFGMEKWGKRGFGRRLAVLLSQRDNEILSYCRTLSSQLNTSNSLFSPSSSGFATFVAAAPCPTRQVRAKVNSAAAKRRWRWLVHSRHSSRSASSARPTPAHPGRPPGDFRGREPQARATPPARGSPEALGRHRGPRPTLRSPPSTPLSLARQPAGRELPPEQPQQLNGLIGPELRHLRAAATLKSKVLSAAEAAAPDGAPKVTATKGAGGHPGERAPCSAPNNARTALPGRPEAAAVAATASDPAAARNGLVEGNEPEEEEDEQVRLLASALTAGCSLRSSLGREAEPGEDRTIRYVRYESELQMPDIMRLITKDLSEPYSIYTYRYFIHNWPQLCFLAMVGEECVGAIVCKLDMHKKMFRRGYIAMLAVDSKYRRNGIGTNLVKKAIYAMVEGDCDEVVLETEITNKSALKLYENLGFVRDKRLFRYYLNGVDALRLKLWLR
ncbi:N-alpha-acetyltransferase 30 [Microtus ochrogaster]|uniref:N-alpha-acetyltransferase 30 n=1 Tax=Microtus ochrogaster TaxID=79684 RepID=A0A8J6GFZ3_MICOH|nr:N-alpha-acetyltransferase 30 [Microtus ochrogaster]